jgi:hypothetical protein
VRLNITSSGNRTKGGSLLARTRASPSLTTARAFSLAVRDMLAISGRWEFGCDERVANAVQAGEFGVEL